MPAPYSDNLYSGDGDVSDDDQNDALSPTDGYFHASSTGHRQRQSSNVPSVPNVLVEDPSLRQEDAAAAAKAREAEEERLINNVAGHSSPSAPATLPHQPVSYYSYSQSQQLQVSSISTLPAASTTSPTSYHQPADAPPAYSPSPFLPPPVSGYQTFASWDFAAHPATMGFPEEHEALLPRQPESMGGGPPNDPQPSMWRRLTDSTSPDMRKKIKTLLGVLVIASIVFALFGIGPSHKKPYIVDHSPVKRPETSPRRDMEWRPSPGCLYTPSEPLKITESITFGTDKKLGILHDVENDDGKRRGRGTLLHVSGEIILQPVDASSAGSIQLEIISNDENQNVKVAFDKKNQQFTIFTPFSVDWPESRLAPCIQIRATVSIPRESHLQSFTVESTLLDVQIKDGLVLISSDMSSINTVSGRIRTGRVSGDLAPYTLASRTVEIETVSGDIDGWFPLYDVLSICTVSGNINTDVTPKSSADKDPEPAVLAVTSVSGNVRIKEPLDQANSSGGDNFPSRDYVVRVKTASGHVEGDLAFTSLAKFEAESSDFRLRLLPLLDSTYSSSSKSLLQTITKSGDTELTVLEPVQKDSAASVGHPGLSFLGSHHSSVSGNFELVYPGSWEGNLSLATFSGSQSVHGEGLKLTRTGAVLKQIKGTKGDGHSELTVKSMSGDQDVYIGDGYEKH